MGESQPTQQRGGMTLLEFAAMHALTSNQAWRLAKLGRILGARRDYTGKWTVFPPARISEPLQRSGRSGKRKGAVPPSGTGDMGDASPAHAVTHPPQAVLDAPAPLTADRQAERAVLPFACPPDLCDTLRQAAHRCRDALPPHRSQQRDLANLFDLFEPGELTQEDEL